VRITRIATQSTAVLDSPSAPNRRDYFVCAESPSASPVCHPSLPVAPTRGSGGDLPWAQYWTASALNPQIELSKINVLERFVYTNLQNRFSPEAEQVGAAAHNDSRSANYAGYFWLPQRPMEAGSVQPLQVIAPINPLFHEGAQNLRATPRCTVLVGFSPMSWLEVATYIDPIRSGLVYEH
jgi:hypothetical protein